jgi:diacylglycerol kinase
MEPTKPARPDSHSGGDKKRFSMIARIESSTHAWRGLAVFARTTHNFWIHFVCAIFVVYLGWMLRINSEEWIFVVIAIGFVFIAEAFNSAIEIDIDLTSPDYHPYARDTKDVAAGAVLLSVAVAVLIGVIIFMPKLLYLFIH